MRKRYRWDREANKLVPIIDRAERGPLICPDIDDFVSPIDGTIIHGRRSLREHMKKHNVTHAQDFTGEWERKRKEREEYFQGKTARNERIEALRYALEKRR